MTSVITTIDIVPRPRVAVREVQAVATLGLQRFARSGRAAFAGLATLLFVSIAGIGCTQALAQGEPAQTPSPQGTEGAGRRASPEANQRLREAVGAVVRIRMQALRDATSMELLGPDREGTGVVIDSNGLILT
ncbi:MAG: hypothetical protein H7125_07830, partial [Proteobacteria bacterium]|nr:hypothetical protein [Burkholderiales bacterium]